MPVVNYLVLDPARLMAWECVNCRARYFDRRNACAGCGLTSFVRAQVASRGSVTAFTIVHVGDQFTKVPFVSAVVNCAGTSVRANLVNVEPVPDSIHINMPVRLTTWSLGLDDEGVEAIAYGFEPDREQTA